MGEKRFTLGRDSVAPHPSSRPPLEGLLDRIAERQHGIVTLDQLREAGFTRQMVWHRIRKGRFAPLHRGVYRVGPRLSARADEMAAVLACGPRALLSHRSAAALWELLPSPWTVGAPVFMPREVSVFRSDRGVAAPGILAHRVTTLGPKDRTTREGIPVTTAARTILDLARLAARRPGTAHSDPPADPLPPVTRRDLERAIARAEREGLATLADLRAHLSLRHLAGLARSCSVRSWTSKGARRSRAPRRKRDSSNWCEALVRRPREPTSGSAVTNWTSSGGVPVLLSRWTDSPSTLRGTGSKPTASATRNSQPGESWSSA